MTIRNKAAIAGVGPLCHPEPCGVGPKRSHVVQCAAGAGRRAKDLFSPNLVVA